LENAAEFVVKMGFKGKSYWLNKANIFSLLVAVADLQKQGYGIDSSRVREALEAFERALPAEYRLAATEAVNSTRARQLRHQRLTQLMLQSMG
jgi:hypothetical protein